MRRYVWAVLFAMIVCAVAAQGVFVARHRPRVTVVESTDECSPVVVATNTRGDRRARTEMRVVTGTTKPVKPLKQVQSPADDPESVRRNKFSSKPEVTKELARKKAVNEAISWLTHELNLTEAVSAEFFDRNDVAKTDYEEGESVFGTDTHIAVLHVAVTRSAERELLDLDRRHLAAGRMDMAGRGVALLTVMLGAVAGFVRLDEWTKGYYTKRLGALMGGLVLAATALIVSV